jgi:hypothetical protein
MILRKKRPEDVLSGHLGSCCAGAGALICLAMIAGLGIDNWIRLIVWLIIECFLLRI